MVWNDSGILVMGILMREQEETTTTAPPARTADRARVLNNMVTLLLRSDSILSCPTGRYDANRKRGGTLRGLRINREILIFRKPLIEVEYRTPTRKY